MGVEMISTTNPSFKYLAGTEVEVENFTVGLVIWFGNFHTSTLERIVYRHTANHTDLVATTRNSKYVFRIGENEDG